MASRSLIDLAAPVRHAAMAFQAACHARGLNALIYCTLRSNEEQAALYAQGRTAPGRIVTNAAPGVSLHNPDAAGHAWAFDAVPILHGVALWSDDDALLTMGICGESVGLTWAGRWRGPLKEKVHFQMEHKS